jgi:hypothetical protein
MITLNLTVEQVNTILAALQEMPYKVSSQLITEIVKQSNEQLKKQEDATNSK